MATFVIETYLSRTRAQELDAVTAPLVEAIAATAQTIDRPGAPPPVRWVRSYFVPEDEVCYHVLEAEALDQVHEVCRAAALVADRIVRAETIPRGAERGRVTRR